MLGGSGLSSSAAFEVLLVCILDGLYNDSIIDGVTRAKISQWVENEYFGKPSGLMDQSACSIGGLVGIDFKNADPKIEAYFFDFEARGFNVVVLATNSSHDDLTDEYASIPAEMKAVAAALGGKVLRQFEVQQLIEKLPEVREKTSDRAVMRALHYYDENERVKACYQAIEEGGNPGRFPAKHHFERRIQLEDAAKPLCRRQVRAEPGAGLRTVRADAQGAAAHGACMAAAFAGTILAFVPHLSSMHTFSRWTRCLAGRVHGAGIRPVGAKKVEL